MYTDKDRTYLVFQLFNGNDYQEYSDNSVSYASNGGPGQGAQFMRNGFRDYRLVISLESFGIKRTDENQFEYHEYMKDLKQLSSLTDSLRKDYTAASLTVAGNSRQYYNYQFKADGVLKQKKITEGKWLSSLLKKQTAAIPDLAQVALSTGAECFILLHVERKFPDRKGKECLALPAGKPS